LAFAGDSTMTRALPIFTFTYLILPGIRRWFHHPLATCLKCCGHVGGDQPFHLSTAP